MSKGVSELFCQNANLDSAWGFGSGARPLLIRARREFFRKSILRRVLGLGLALFIVPSAAFAQEKQRHIDWAKVAASIAAHTSIALDAYETRQKLSRYPGAFREQNGLYGGLANSNGLYFATQIAPTVVDLGLIGSRNRKLKWLFISADAVLTSIHAAGAIHNAGLRPAPGYRRAHMRR